MADPIQAKVNLNSLDPVVIDVLGDLDKTTSALIASTADGGEADLKSLVALQIGLAKYTTSASVVVAISKEVSDALKGVAAKIS